MKLCYKCNSRMVEVKLIDIKGQSYRALVCTYCGHTYSRDKAFKGNLELRAG